jgi:N-acetylglucosaminyl-diphospho-decaprenol L-rhamnosyltransferase
VTARVSVVVVSYETRDDLAACLRSLAAEGGPGLETTVVDNASGDGSADLVARDFPAVRLVRNARNDGFGAACNRGASGTAAPYLLFLNSDAQVTAGAVAALARVLDQRPDVAIVGPRTLNDDGTAQVSYGRALTPRAEWRQRRLVRGVARREPWALAIAQERSLRACAPDWVSGACLLIRRRAFDAVSGFDEGFFLYEEDADLCARVRAQGGLVRFEPAATVVHRLGRSMARAAERARLEYHRSHLRYYRKHNGPLATAALRAGLAARALAGLAGSWVRRDEAARTYHRGVWTLAARGVPFPK